MKQKNGRLSKGTTAGRIFLLISMFIFLSASSALAVLEDQLPNDSWSGIVWGDTNISRWQASATMTGASVGSGGASFPYDMACEWPGHIGGNLTGMGETVGNVWAIVKYNGKWVAGTWEYLRPCQTTKAHFNSPRGTPSGWKPASGAEMYIFVSGIIRVPNRVTIAARSNVVRTTYNGGFSPAGDEDVCPNDK